VVSVEPVIIAAATRCLTLDLAAEEVQAGVADSGVGPLFWPDTPRVVVAFALALSPPCTVPRLRCPSARVFDDEALGVLLDHVRNAPLATVRPKKAACRNGPKGDK
jgi:hypothetical protein